MLRHFENLNTPLKCVHTYPNLQDQESRFQGAGYRSVHVRSLWDLWHDSSVVTPRHQKHLNTVEPFDEWEELALFSMHYFLLEAVKCPDAPDSAETPCLVSDPQRSKLRKDAEAETKGHNLQILTSPNDGQRRKFSAVTSFSGDRIGLHGGIGSEGRMQTTDRFQLPGVEAKCERLPDPPSNIQARACHTITRLNNGKDLLVGGRTSPHEAMHGCRLRNSNGWKAVHDLPKPLYRHCATAVTLGEGDNVAGVLVFGGRTTGGKANGEWYLWQENNGWDVLSVGYGNLEPRFGATIAATGPCEGLLLGGMIEEGTLCNGVFEWSIRDNSTSIWVRQVEIVGLAPRMGACLVPSPAGLLLIGGVSRSMLTEGEEILCIRDVTSKEHQGPREVSQTPLIARFMETSPVTVDFGSSRPLLVGHAAYAADLTLLIVGGGAVCFSFGKTGDPWSRSWI